MIITLAITILAICYFYALDKSALRAFGKGSSINTIKYRD